jgi:hypothetical protein
VADLYSKWSCWTFVLSRIFFRSYLYWVGFCTEFICNESNFFTEVTCIESNLYRSYLCWVVFCTEIYNESGFVHDSFVLRQILSDLICVESCFVQKFVLRQIFSEVICIETGFVQKFFVLSRFLQTLFVLSRVLYRSCVESCFVQKFVLHLGLYKSCTETVTCIDSCSCRSYFPSFRFGTEVICFEWRFCRNYWHCTDVMCIESCVVQNVFVLSHVLYKMYLYWVVRCTECICIESCVVQNVFVLSHVLYKMYLYWVMCCTECICIESCVVQNVFVLSHVLYRMYLYWVMFLYRMYLYWVMFCTECICIEFCVVQNVFVLSYVLYRMYLYWVMCCTECICIMCFTECICIESCVVQNVFVLSHVLYRMYLYWVMFAQPVICESILLNRHTSDILSYFLLVKRPTIRILASLAQSGTVTALLYFEHVSVLRRMNVMTPRVLSFPLHKISGL